MFCANDTGFRGGFDKRRLAVVLVVLAVGVLLVRFDSKVEPYIAESGRTGSVDVVEDAWKELGSTFGIALFLVAGAFSTKKDTGRTLVTFAACVAASSAVGQVAKYLIGRARP